tara:strand:- start:270 stop:530 length:261 start_codon:yes stop_codon:yes gene_type:complete
MISGYPFLSSLTTIKQTTEVMIKVINDIDKSNIDAYPREIGNHIDSLQQMLRDYTIHLSDLIEAERMNNAIQLEIKEGKYSRWKQL